MLGREEEDRWESEGGHLLDKNDSPEEKNEDSEELVLRNHPGEPGFLSWKKLTDK